VDKIKTDPTGTRSRHYDIVVNGVELGGGSIRNHRQEVQAQVFEVLGFDPETAKKKFGFLMEALQYGAPPHGGIALGLDRLMVLMLGGQSIRDVIPFPKTQSAADLMCDAPSDADPAQLRELQIKLDLDK
jgi:aspartyl-tRNA synthetase